MKHRIPAWTLIAAALLILAAVPAFADGPVIDVSLNMQVSVTGLAPQQEQWYEYTPEEDGLYIWKALSCTQGAEIGIDSRCTDAYQNETKSVDAYLTAGKTVRLSVRNKSADASVNCTAMLTLHPGLERARAVGDLTRSVSPGTPVTLAVNASAKNGSLAYAWRKDGDLLSGQDGPSLVTDPVEASHSYSCWISDEYDREEVISFYVLVDNGLTAYGSASGFEGDLTDDLTGTVVPGSTVTMNVFASCDNGPLSYLWSVQDGSVTTNIGTSPTCTVGPVNKSAYYYCRVSDQYGNGESISFCVKVDNGLTLLDEQVYSITKVRPGHVVTLSPNVTCTTGSLHYQWYERVERYDPTFGEYSNVDRPIDGATDSFLVLTVDSEKWITCEISDDYDNSVSIVYWYGVDNQLTASLSNVQVRQTANPNSTVNIAVSASCLAGSITYEWRVSYDDYDWITLNGETSSSVTSYPVTKETSYACDVRDEYGNLQTVTCTLVPDNQLSVQPAGMETWQMIPYGETAVLQVEASYLNGPVAYQWMITDRSGRINEIVPGAESPSITTEPVTEVLNYTCRVTDEYGGDECLSFELTPDTGLQARAKDDRTYIDVVPRETALLEVIATCSVGGIHYQWSASVSSDNPWATEEIPGETGASITTVPITHYIVYICRVWDDIGTERYVQFSLSPNNRLQLVQLPYERSVPRGSYIELGVEGSCLVGSLTYEWYLVDASGMDVGVIPGATSNRLTYGPIESRVDIRCRVSDEFNNYTSSAITVFVDNGFRVAAMNETFVVPYGGDLTIAIEAACDEGDIHYAWHDISSPEDAPAAYFTNVTDPTTCGCVVTDDYGNEAGLWFEIKIDNQLTAVPKDGITRYVVSPGDNVTLETVVSCLRGRDDLIFYWEAGSDGSNAFTAEGTRCVVSNIQQASSIVFCVYDMFGNSASVSFTIEIDNGFTASEVGGTVHETVTGQQVTLAVSASARSGDISYQWSNEFNEQLDETGSSITVTAERSTAYYCRVTDRYGNRYNAFFFLVAADATVIRSGQTIEVTPREDGYSYITYVSFTPEVSGIYNLASIGSRDAFALLFDSHGNQLGYSDDYQHTYDFRLGSLMTAGQRYLFRVQSYGADTFRIRLTMGNSGLTEKTLFLRSGQTVRLPLPEGCTVTSGDTSVVSVADGYRITANAQGAAALNVDDHGCVTAYYVSVGQGSGVLTLPTSLTVVEANAFDGDNSFSYATLGSRVTRVEEFAFANTALLQLRVVGKNTRIAFSALYGLTPTILCREDSEAAALAKDMGLVYAYTD